MIKEQREKFEKQIAQEKRIAELEKGKKDLFQNLLDLEKLYQDEKKENAESKQRRR